uniref:Uncharacterized protein n=1 Tax=Aureoumbra lagunensis TaxID=44058 RepID=A0A7S3K3M0_9STRA
MRIILIILKVLTCFSRSATPESTVSPVDIKEKEVYSPLVAVARAVYQRSPFQSAVQVVGPQAAVVGRALGIGAEKARRHITLPTATALGLCVLPLGAMRSVVRGLAACGLGAAGIGAARQARLESMLPSLDPASSWAIVTGCEERAGIGASAARALAARGFGVVIVASTEAEAKAMARRLRADHKVPCLPVAVELSGDARHAVHELRHALHSANLTDAIDIVVHAPIGIFNAHIHHTSPGLGENNNNNKRYHARHDTEQIETEEAFDHFSVWDAALQARCGTATQLVHLFGTDMAARGKGRCALVVGGAGTELANALSSAQPPDAATFFTAKATLEASDAYTKALSKAMRRDLSRFGVGVTLASRDASFHIGSRFLPGGAATEATGNSPGDILVDALLRGESQIALNLDNAAGFAPRFAAAAAGPIYSLGGPDILAGHSTRPPYSHFDLGPSPDDELDVSQTSFVKHRRLANILPSSSHICRTLFP